MPAVPSRFRYGRTFLRRHAGIRRKTGAEAGFLPAARRLAGASLAAARGRRAGHALWVPLRQGRPAAGRCHDRDEYRSRDHYGGYGGRKEERGWWDRASDEVSSGSATTTQATGTTRQGQTTLTAA